MPPFPVQTLSIFNFCRHLLAKLDVSLIHDPDEIYHVFQNSASIIKPNHGVLLVNKNDYSLMMFKSDNDTAYDILKFNSQWKVIAAMPTNPNPIHYDYWRVLTDPYILIAKSGLIRKSGIEFNVNLHDVPVKDRCKFKYRGILK